MPLCGVGFCCIYLTSLDYRNSCQLAVVGLMDGAIESMWRESKWWIGFRSASLCNMQSMMLIAPNVLITGGHQPLLVSFDLETRQEIQQVREFTY